MIQSSEIFSLIHNNRINAKLIEVGRRHLTVISIPLIMFITILFYVFEPPLTNLGHPLLIFLLYSYTVVGMIALSLLLFLYYQNNTNGMVEKLTSIDLGILIILISGTTLLSRLSLNFPQFGFLSISYSIIAIFEAVSLFMNFRSYNEL